MTGSAELTVVVVEDDTSMAQALARILRIGGMTSVNYGSAEALLGAAKGIDGASCLVFDVQLPGLDGFELHDRLANACTLPPVIFITAFDDAETRARARRANAAAFLAKPFAGRTLLHTIRQATATMS
jgi:FixJ family two-component response regulator